MAQFGTQCVTGAPPTGPGVPIHLSTTYVLDSAEHGAKLASRLEEGWLYTRWANPTTNALTDVVGRLEGGQALAFGSGMAAITTCILSLAGTGSHIIAPKAIYGGTSEFLENMAPRHGIEVSFVDATDIGNYERAMKENTTIMYSEVPSNPTTRLTDLPALGALGKKHKITTMCDCTFASVYNLKALPHGIDISLHSATKYYGGHSDVTAGLMSTSSEDLFEKVLSYARILGGILSPFDSYNLLRGIKTLEVRMEKHNANAMAVAEFLDSHPKVEFVHYPGLPHHPDHELAKKLLRGFGGMLSFEVKGGLEAGRTVLEGVKLINLAVSLGSVESLIEQAATMTHTMVPEEQRLEAGITPGLLRLSVGLESTEDLIADLSNALDMV